ncbi:Germination-specific N-acetylmuramoyl-L-alanine amidase [Sporomusa acidovorans DSM 3132]|uniref:Germination-specific N-acetylmuramoyl-L-alanine amidase n=2 Tax=Sporomusa TaxID=2375 RepID=A0ABZ3IXI6_SPOA4|nr:germination-specific N-acetylmuramoyl-L-alanine amidase precursor [Sporomusa acidovorans DSM 3132]SDF39994.1 N-acetylmuramoyl-L-alanine amidase [Sporomusa acidovorans]
MRVLAIRRKRVLSALLFSIAVVVLNLLTLRYLVMVDLDNVDLTVLNGKTIAIDAGHGGIDDGAKGNGLVEKNINLAIAAKLASILADNGAKTVFTREGDIDYYTKGKGGKRNDLLKRAEIIDASGANLYLSIHCNAIKGANWSGAQVFYNPKLEENRQLAEIAQQALRNFPSGNKRQAKQDSDIILLKTVTIPGVLIEAGFISNPTEAAQLNTEAYQQKLAESIAKALAYHFSQNVGR